MEGASEAGAEAAAEAGVVVGVVVGQAGVVDEPSDASSNASHGDVGRPARPRLLTVDAVRQLSLTADAAGQLSLTVDVVVVPMGWVVMPRVAMAVRNTVNLTIRTFRKHRVVWLQDPGMVHHRVTDQELVMLQEALVTVLIPMGRHQRRFRNRPQQELRYQCLLLLKIPNPRQRHLRLQHPRRRFLATARMKPASGHSHCRAMATIRTPRVSLSMFRNKPRCLSTTDR